MLARWHQALVNEAIGQRRSVETATMANHSPVPVELRQADMP